MLVMDLEPGLGWDLPLIELRRGGEVEGWRLLFVTHRASEIVLDRQACLVMVNSVELAELGEMHA